MIKQTDTKNYRWLDKKLNGVTDSWRDGKKDRKIDSQTDRQTDGQKERTEKQTYAVIMSDVLSEFFFAVFGNLSRGRLLSHISHRGLHLKSVPLP